MEIKYRKQAQKMLRAMQPAQSRAIIEALRKLAEDPSRTDVDVRPMVNVAGFRLRVGKWRAIFLVAEDILWVERIAARGDVYKA